MIKTYYRPKTLEETLKLLARSDTHPLGGGTILNRPRPDSFSVVDLQALGLDKIHKSGDKLAIGAMVTLQLLLESTYTPEALKSGIRLEAQLNLRNMKTVAGSLVASDGRSPFAVIMLALDAKVSLEGGPPAEKSSAVCSLGNLLPLLSEILQGKLIAQIEIPLNVMLAFETVARTPMDKPIVCTALARWPSGRMRLALGGWGKLPLLAMDGNESGGVETAAKNTFHEAGDAWASATYRSEIASVLAKRCLDSINKYTTHNN